MGVSMGEFTRDSSHWLRRYSPDEWIRASLAELARADKAWQQHSPLDLACGWVRRH